MIFRFSHTLKFPSLHAQKNIANGSDFLPTGLRPLYRIRWQMITSVNLKPVYRSNIDHLRGGAIPPYGVTTRKTRRVVGRSQVGLLLTLIERSTGVSSMQKVVRVHYLSFASDGIIKNNLDCIILCIYYPSGMVFLINAGGFVSLAQWASSRYAEDVGSIPAGYVAYGQKIKLLFVELHK
jgi:hypothetical protein